jgi:long-chain fatty acid transport protein
LLEFGTLGMGRPTSLARILVVVGALGIASASAASTAEVYGLGPVSSAQAGAVAASVTDFSAVHYNPAGLVFSPVTRVDLGFLGAGSGLEIQGHHVSLQNQSGPLVGGRAPLPFGGFLKDRLTFGFALFVPPATLLRIISRYPQEAFFPLYDNRSQRLIVLPGFGFRMHERLGLGIAFNYFGGLSGAVQGAAGASRAIEPRADEHIGGRVGINAGVRWDPLRFLSLALAYRQQFDLPFHVTSDVQVAGSPINLAVRSAGLYSPHQLVLGAAYHPRPSTTLGLDVTWAHWSAWDGPYIHVTSTLPLAGDLVGELPDVPFHDIVTVHVGGEQRFALGRRFELALRAGYGYDQSPIPRQQPGVTNLMDGDKHLLTIGAGGRVKKLGPATLTLDAHFGIQLVTQRTYTKHIFGKDEEIVPFNGLRDEVKDSTLDPASRGIQISNPGYPSIKGGGFVWSASVLLGVEL